MSDIIPPMVSTTPPPLAGSQEDEEEDEFGDFASANYPYQVEGITESPHQDEQEISVTKSTNLWQENETVQDLKLSDSSSLSPPQLKSTQALESLEATDEEIDEELKRCSEVTERTIKSALTDNTSQDSVVSTTTDSGLCSASEEASPLPPPADSPTKVTPKSCDSEDTLIVAFNNFYSGDPCPSVTTSTDNISNFQSDSCSMLADVGAKDSCGSAVPLSTLQSTVATNECEIQCQTTCDQMSTPQSGDYGDFTQAFSTDECPNVNVSSRESERTFTCLFQDPMNDTLKKGLESSLPEFQCGVFSGSGDAPKLLLDDKSGFCKTYLDIHESMSDQLQQSQKFGPAGDAPINYPFGPAGDAPIHYTFGSAGDAPVTDPFGTAGDAPKSDQKTEIELSRHPSETTCAVETLYSDDDFDAFADIPSKLNFESEVNIEECQNQVERLRDLNSDHLKDNASTCYDFAAFPTVYNDASKINIESRSQDVFDDNGLPLESRCYGDEGFDYFSALSSTSSINNAIHLTSDDSPQSRSPPNTECVSSKSGPVKITCLKSPDGPCDPHYDLEENIRKTELNSIAHRVDGPINIEEDGFTNPENKTSHKSDGPSLQDAHELTDDDDFDDFADFSSAHLPQETSTEWEASFSAPSQGCSVLSEEDEDEDNYTNFKSAIKLNIPPSASSLKAQPSKDILASLISELFPKGEDLEESRFTETIPMLKPWLRLTNRGIPSAQHLPSIYDIQNSPALELQWGSCSTHTRLLRALGIDSRNILYGQRWNSSMPRFAANLGQSPLEPVRADLSSMSQSTNSSVLDGSEEGVPAAQFDWTGSGLINPLDHTIQSALILDHDFFLAAFDNLACPSASAAAWRALTTSKLSRVAPSPAALNEEPPTSSDDAFIQETQNLLSGRARSILATLPNLSYMKSPYITTNNA